MPVNGRHAVLKAWERGSIARTSRLGCHRGVDPREMLENRRGIVCAPSHRVSGRRRGSLLVCLVGLHAIQRSKSPRCEGNAREPNRLYCRCHRHHRRSPVVLRIAVEKRTRSAECASAGVCMHKCKRHVPVRRMRIAEETAVFRPSPAPCTPCSLIARGLSAAKGLANTVRSTADIPVALCGTVDSQRSRYLAYRATSTAIVHRKSERHDSNASLA